MFTDTMLPAPGAPSPLTGGAFSPFQPVPGLTKPAIDGLQASFPGILTPEMSKLLGVHGGLDRTPLGYIDFTGQWHEEEPLAVFRPCLTLALDERGRRWIAETHRSAGLPGPVWCIQQSPQVAIYIADDLQTFIKTLKKRTSEGSVAAWSKTVDAAAAMAWQRRGALAFQTRQRCEIENLGRWLLQLPRDARVFDLRSPQFGTAWPYGVAGPHGRFHRRGRELLFAVSGFPAPARWVDFMGDLAWHHDAPAPAVVARRHRPAPPRDYPARSGGERRCA